MSGIVEFLRARIGEDEKDILPRADGRKRRESGGWSRKRRMAECEAKRRIIERHQSTEVLDHWEFGCTCGFRDHRKSECVACGNTTYDEGELTRPFGPCPDIRLLALPYADHPDFDETWRG